MATDKPIDLVVATDYICHLGIEAEQGFSMLKLHKLLYYVQAWHLALYKTPLFDARFEAWVHGPVCRKVYARFHGRSMYDTVVAADLKTSDFSSLSLHARQHIENVLDSYAGLSGPQLEDITHGEDPWIKARGGLPPLAKCETEITQDSMRTYYGLRLEIGDEDVSTRI